MPIDASIPLGIKPPAPRRGLAEFLPLQADLMKVQAARNAMAADTAIRQQLSAPNFLSLAPEEQLRQLGAVGGVAGLEAANTFGEARKAQADAAKAQFEQQQAQLKQAMLDIAGASNIAGLNGLLESRVAKGMIDQQQAEEIRAQFPTKEEDLPKAKQQMLANMLTAEERLKRDFFLVDGGDEKKLYAFRGDGSSPTVYNTKVGLTPDQQADNALAGRRLEFDMAKEDAKEGAGAGLPGDFDDQFKVAGTLGKTFAARNKDALGSITASEDALRLPVTTYLSDPQAAADLLYKAARALNGAGVLTAQDVNSATGQTAADFFGRIESTVTGEGVLSEEQVLGLYRLTERGYANMVNNLGKDSISVLDEARGYQLPENMNRQVLAGYTPREFGFRPPTAQEVEERRRQGADDRDLNLPVKVRFADAAARRQFYGFPATDNNPGSPTEDRGANPEQPTQSGAPAAPRPATPPQRSDAAPARGDFRATFTLNGKTQTRRYATEAQRAEAIRKVQQAGGQARATN